MKSYKKHKQLEKDKFPSQAKQKHPFFLNNHHLTSITLMCCSSSQLRQLLEYFVKKSHKYIREKHFLAIPFHVNRTEHSMMTPFIMRGM